MLTSVMDFFEIYYFLHKFCRIDIKLCRIGRGRLMSTFEDFRHTKSNCSLFPWLTICLNLNGWCGLWRLLWRLYCWLSFVRMGLLSKALLRPGWSQVLQYRDWCTVYFVQQKHCSSLSFTWIKNVKKGGALIFQLVLIFKWTCRAHPGPGLV